LTRFFSSFFLIDGLSYVLAQDNPCTLFIFPKTINPLTSNRRCIQQVSAEFKFCAFCPHIAYMQNNSRFPPTPPPKTVWSIWALYWWSNGTIPKTILTYSMEQSPSWEANWFCSQSRNSPHFWSPKFPHRTHKCPPPVPIL